ncbi:ankyrin repeat, partial [Brachionus plicatilis]
KNVCEVIKFLGEIGCDFNTRYEKGNTALHFAATLESESDKVIKILIKNGAYVNTMNNYLQTPLFASVKSNNILAASSLLDFNADIYSRDINGLTAFDLIRDVEEWTKSDCFNKDQKLILKTFEYKQTRTLIRKISHKIKTDFSSKALLNKRKYTLSSYLNNNYMVPSISITPRAIRT